MTVYVLLSRNRSGSGALGSMLDQTTTIQYLWEAFHEGQAHRPENYFSFMRQLCREHPDAWMPSQAATRLDGYLQFLESLSSKRDVLISIKYNSMHHFNKLWMDLGEAPTLFAMLRERKIPVVHLRRKNHLRVYVSALVAEMNGVWHSRDPVAVKAGTLRLDSGKCLRYLAGQCQEDARVALALGGYPRILELEYASVFDLRGRVTQDAMHALAGFCRVPIGDIREPDLIKLTPRSLRSVIANYEEVETSLAGSPYEWMLMES
jgi:hypothetical protein